MSLEGDAPTLQASRTAARCLRFSERHTLVISVYRYLNLSHSTALQVLGSLKPLCSASSLQVVQAFRREGAAPVLSSCQLETVDEEASQHADLQLPHPGPPAGMHTCT